MTLFKRRDSRESSGSSNDAKHKAYVYVPPKDDRKAVCPSCNGKLAKIPGSKTKCPMCGAPMFVRTDPRTRSRLVVTAAQADAIDDETARLNGTYEQRLTEKKRRARIEASLAKKSNGKQPSQEDIEWRVLNQDGIKWARNHWWASYSLNLCQKAEAYESRGKLDLALQFFFMSMYLEYNGAQDFGQNAESRKLLTSMGFNEFDPAKASPPLFRCTRIKKIAEELDLNSEILESRFYDAVSKIKLGELPLSPDEVWFKLKADL